MFDVQFFGKRIGEPLLGTLYVRIAPNMSNLDRATDWVNCGEIVILVNHFSNVQSCSVPGARESDTFDLRIVPCAAMAIQRGIRRYLAAEMEWHDLRATRSTLTSQPQPPSRIAFMPPDAEPAAN